MTDFTSYVNIKQGTASDMRFSSGNTLPLVSVPFGMHAYSLQTLGRGGGWFYHPSHRQCEGIRLTHQPSPWMRDYGHIVMMPQSGNPSPPFSIRRKSFIMAGNYHDCGECFSVHRQRRTIL